MTRRPGLSLTEVLVALFIMGIGTIAILTLFPLGALNMAQAFRDDRCTQAASQADAFLRYYVKDKASRNSSSNNLTAAPPTGEPFYHAMSDPDPGKVATAQLIPVPPTPPPAPMRAGYPVVIDPLGYLNRGGRDDNPSDGKGPILWVGEKGFGDNTTPHTSALARRSLRSINSLSTPAANLVKQQPLAIRTCTLLDGFGYDPSSGSPAVVSVGGPVDRDLRYNWLWVLQRLPDDSNTTATMTVVVFDKRSPSYVAPGAETVWTPSTATVGQTQLSFAGSYAANNVPMVQKGGWLLDATVCLIKRATPPATPQFFVPAPGPTPPPAGAEPWVRNANFYRVVSATESATGVDVELDTPLRPDTGDVLPGDPAVPATHRRFIYLTGVAEVFERDRKLEFTP